MTQVKIYTASPSDMSPPVDDKSFCTDFVLATDYQAMKEQVVALAAELSAVDKIRTDAVFITDADFDKCPPSVQKVIRNFALMALPSTSKFIAEQQASVIPEGYVLVPQQIFLDQSDIESICSQCGDGHESGYGDFTDGLLWVGNIQRDDGSIVHGLHISSADYTEEGGVTICEFAAQQLRDEVKS